MKKFKEYIKEKKVLVGMIHIKALPGTPKNNLEPHDIINEAIQEAKTFKKRGINVLAIENMHDVPYTKKPGPEITAMMAIIGKEIKKLGVYCGIQILAGANKEALAVAKAANLDFIRVEGFVFGHIADEGYMESCAGELMRYRKQISAEDILIFTDIKKKHSSHAITSDVNIVETAQAAEFFLSDGVIITGTSTGKETDPVEVREVKKAVKIPVLIGSGIMPENLNKYIDYADIFIVGSYIKKNGSWKNELDENRIEKLVKKFNELKK